MAKIKPSDIQVIELHDCFSANELITYEALGVFRIFVTAEPILTSCLNALGLCKVGEAAKLVETNQVTYGGKWVVNPSGGLISKGVVMSN